MQAILTKDYTDFLKSKAITNQDVGRRFSEDAVNPVLFDFQRAITLWALRKGRAAIFADTGLGKTPMQLEWARLLNVPTLIVAPLSVARQTVREANKLGLDVDIGYSRDGTLTNAITITNYEMAHTFESVIDDIGAVVLDESSILKAYDGKTRQYLTELFCRTPYRLCCTATPAPNDIAELTNHTEFLGIMSRRDMLATFFVHKESGKTQVGWVLKGHARIPFYRWMASWAMSIRLPSDLGYDDDGFILPPLTVIPEWVDYEYVPEGQMFNTGLEGVTDRRRVRRGSLDDRCQRAADIVNDSDDVWICWVGLNAEETRMHELVPDSRYITGSMPPHQKAELIEAFQDGDYRVLITKASIAGFGVNLQQCHNQMFVGLDDSFERYYQAIRRSWRYGQNDPVNVHIVLSHIEAPIWQNVRRKEEEAKIMSEQLIKWVGDAQRDELLTKKVPLDTDTESVNHARYSLYLGDSCEIMPTMPDNSVDLAVFSPPFSAIYVYNPTVRDLANSRDMEEFFEHFRFIIDELLRVTKPGRLCCVHLMQLPATLVNDGFMGLVDFRGRTIDAFTNAGWHFYGEAVIQKNPQVQAIRTKSHMLLFKTLHKDSARLAPGIPDYILIFKKPGENAVPITPVEHGEMDNETWISWAHPIWTDIKQTDVLNVRLGRAERDEKHIAPLQLGVIERCVIMYSNPGEVVLDPFMGLGSTGVVALQHGRRAIGIELKRSYYEVAARYMAEAAGSGTYQLNMFELMGGNGDGHQSPTAE